MPCRTARFGPRLGSGRSPRPPERDSTLGIAVEVDRTGDPVNRLVTIGDSLTHGFMGGAIFRTDLSWPAVVAYELGTAHRARLPLPDLEPPSGPGGPPLDLEPLVAA